MGSAISHGLREQRPALGGGTTEPRNCTSHEALYPRRCSASFGRLLPAWLVVRQGTGPSPGSCFRASAGSGLFEMGRPSDSQAALSTLAVKGAYSRRHGKADHRGESPALHRRVERERFREPDQPAAAVSRVPDADSARESHR
jgi:hypothetical protein